MSSLLSRRQLLGEASLLVMCAALPDVAVAATTLRMPRRAAALPLSDVRLAPSDFLRATQANRRTLLDLNADRLLHNFRKYAGLEPKAAIYGGWESETLAGHSLGHYLTALVLMHAQTGDAECRQRADYIVSELAEAQARRQSGYVGALGRKRKGQTEIVDGEEIFPELMRGDIRSGGFDLNGSWSPLYTVHKLFAGLLDVHAAWNNKQALVVLIGLAGYFERVFAALDDAQMQLVLRCEYGGLNESFAELHARTGDVRWLRIARRLYDNQVLDPLVAQEDRLAGFHANTQVPKLVGLARLYEVTGEVRYRTAAEYFWESVTRHHSYVIGGNSDREYFLAPDQSAFFLSDHTCEHCNTYNMLKLTRHLFSWKPDGALFDYYERAHFNHTLGQLDPGTGGFSYFTPMASGAARMFPPEAQVFVCCGGTGMEAHASHGNSIFWEGEGTLIVNLYIASQAQWRSRGAVVSLRTAYPYDSRAELVFVELRRQGRFPVALRVPSWATGRDVVTVNGNPVSVEHVSGYAIVTRRWLEGDVVAITLPLELRLEEAEGDASIVSILRGPLVMAADLGPADVPWSGDDPVLVGTDVLAHFVPEDAAGHAYLSKGVNRPDDLRFVPFYGQYARRSAIYFRHFTQAAWQQEKDLIFAQRARQKAIDARTVDILHFGEMQPERDHELESERSAPVRQRGRNGRQAQPGGYIAFRLKASSGPLVLQMTYRAGQSGGFEILVDGNRVVTERPLSDAGAGFADLEYSLPLQMTEGKSSLHVRFVPHEGEGPVPVFTVRLLRAQSSPEPVR